MWFSSTCIYMYAITPFQRHPCWRRVKKIAVDSNMTELVQRSVNICTLSPIHVIASTGFASVPKRTERIDAVNIPERIDHVDAVGEEVVRFHSEGKLHVPCRPTMCSYIYTWPSNALLANHRLLESFDQSWTFSILSGIFRAFPRPRVWMPHIHYILQM